MTSKLTSALSRSLGRIARHGRAPITAERGLTLVHVRVVTCCRGWHFEHSTECRTPHVARPCSDCSADPGTAHTYPCCSWIDIEPVTGPEEEALWPRCCPQAGPPIAE
jgi:hypothetical protein